MIICEDKVFAKDVARGYVIRHPGTRLPGRRVAIVWSAPGKAMLADGTVLKADWLVRAELEREG